MGVSALRIHFDIYDINQNNDSDFVSAAKIIQKILNEKNNLKPVLVDSVLNIRLLAFFVSVVL